MTIIVDLTPRKKGGTARLLDMVEGRSEKAFTTWLQERGQAFRERVRVVAMDAFAGYKKAAARILPCISSSRCFVFSHVFFSGLGSCMHFPYFSGCAEV